MLQSNAPGGSPFSKRYGYAGQAKGISIWDDASEDLRQCVLETARDLGLAPSDIRDTVCAVLQRRPNRRNWIEYPNVWEEAQEDVYGCQWFQVYDIIERNWSRFKRADDHSVWEEEKAPAFRQAMNDFFLTNGIGWQLLKGEIVMRGADGFEVAVKTAQATLEESAARAPARKSMKRWRLFPGDQNQIYAVQFITRWVLSNAWPARLPEIPGPLWAKS